MTIYLDYCNTLGEAERSKLNETVIWAVNKLEDNEAHTLLSKLFLSTRMDQLATDLQKIGWRSSTARFRKAIDRWVTTYCQETQDVPSKG
jgi:hypothetical protein